MKDNEVYSFGSCTADSIQVISNRSKTRSWAHTIHSIDSHAHTKSKFQLFHNFINQKHFYNNKFLIEIIPNTNQWINNSRKIKVSSEIERERESNELNISLPKHISQLPMPIYLVMSCRVKIVGEMIGQIRSNRLKSSRPNQVVIRFIIKEKFPRRIFFGAPKNSPII